MIGVSCEAIAHDIQIAARNAARRGEVVDQLRTKAIAISLLRRALIGVIDAHC